MKVIFWNFFFIFSTFLIFENLILLFSEESDFLEFIYDFWKLIANRLHCNYLEHPQSKNKGGQQHPILDFDRRRCNRIHYRPVQRETGWWRGMRIANDRGGLRPAFCACAHWLRRASVR